MDNKRRTAGFRYKPERKVATVTLGRPCWIYFISTDEVPAYPIKIGLSFTGVEKRLRELQTGCPYPLTVLATVEGTPSYEWILHRELHPHRLNGEWFKRCPEVLAEVKEAKRRQAQYEERRRLNEQAWEALPEAVRRKIENESRGIFE